RAEAARRARGRLAASGMGELQGGGDLRLPSGNGTEMRNCDDGTEARKDMAKSIAHFREIA
ncbi:MAG: hypothetical protein ACKON9_18260, partial [Planctomycetaceae bacterium]